MTRGRRGVLILFVLTCLFLLLQSSIVWKWMYPIKYRSEILAASRQYQVSPHLILAVIRSESGFEPDRVSHKGAIGLMQVMPDTADWIVSQAGFQVTDERYLYDPVMNIWIGTWYLRYLLTRFEGNTVKVIAAYNAGPGAVSSWIAENKWSGQRETVEDIPFPETRKYVQRVLYYQDRYQNVYNQQLQ